MKKRLAMLLALAMMMSTTAIAADVEAAGGSSDASVKATYEEGTGASAVIFSVDIEWEGLSFTYYEESNPVWDPTTHDYTSGEYQAEGWDKSQAGTVTVTNHSNTDILANFTYGAKSGFDSATMNFDFAQIYVASPVADKTEKTASNSVVPGGTLPEGTDNAEIGTITVTISQCADKTEDDARGSIEAFHGLYQGLREYCTTGKIQKVDNRADATDDTPYILTSMYDQMNGDYQRLAPVIDMIEDSENDPSQEIINEAYYVLNAYCDFIVALQQEAKQ